MLNYIFFPLIPLEDPSSFCYFPSWIAALCSPETLQSLQCSPSSDDFHMKQAWVQGESVFLELPTQPSLQQLSWISSTLCIITGNRGSCGQAPDPGCAAIISCSQQGDYFAVVWTGRVFFPFHFLSTQERILGETNMTPYSPESNVTPQSVNSCIFTHYSNHTHLLTVKKYSRIETSSSNQH